MISLYRNKKLVMSKKVKDTPSIANVIPTPPNLSCPSMKGGLSRKELNPDVSTLLTPLHDRVNLNLLLDSLRNLSHTLMAYGITFSRCFTQAILGIPTADSFNA